MNLLRSIALFMLMPVMIFISSGIAHAQLESIKKVCEKAPQSSVCTDIQAPPTQDPVSGTNGIIIKGANVVALGVTVVSVIIVIIAGITMALSTGDAGKVKSSRDAIIYAFIGIAVTALARTIIVFVLNRV